MPHDFDWLLSPVSLPQFFDRYFEQEVLHVTGRDAAYYEDIFSVASFEAMVYQSADAVRPTVTCIRTTRTESGIIADRQSGIPAPLVCQSLLASLRGVLSTGYSLVLTGIDRHWLPLARLLREIEALFFNPLATVLFYSPPRVQGAPPHFDPYDNYVLQIAGEKDWKVYKSKIALPLNSQLHSVTEEDFGEPLHVRMRPGDLLYLPRGVIHEAASGDEASLHVTLYNYAYRWRDLVCDIVERLAEQEPALRRSVPLSVSQSIACGASPAEAGAADELMPLLRYCLAHFATVGSVGRHARRMVDNLAPLELGAIEPAFPSGELGGSQCIAKRPGTVCYLYDDDDKVVIGFPGGKLSAPVAVKAVLEFIARSGEPFRLCDLPGELSLRSKEILIRKLVRDGLLFFPTL